jgi:hypothetical protein
MKMKARNTVLPSLICLLLLILAGCEVATSARLGVGPSFSFDGSGRLVSFHVYGPRQGHKIATPVDEQSLMWSIAATSDAPGASVTGMQIAYGKVPTGYVQKFPSSGAALPLANGQVYIFDAETTGAPGVNGFFYMDQSNPILIKVPGLCGSSSVRDVKPVKCGSSEPYIEPKDLAKFVQENRVH